MKLFAFMIASGLSYQQAADIGAFMQYGNRVPLHWYHHSTHGEDNSP